MKAKLFSVVFLLSGVSAFAEPVYLECKLSSEKETKRFSVSLDEATRKVTQTNEKGEAFNTEGFFSANLIKYQDVFKWNELKISLAYEIDRTTLQVVEASTIAPLDPSYSKAVPTTTEKIKGNCAIQKVDGRKI